MKKVISVILVFVILLYSCVAALAVYNRDPIELNRNAHVTDTFLSNQEEALKTSESIDLCIAKERKRSISIVGNEYSINGLYAQAYPDTYAGKYIIH